MVTLVNNIDRLTADNKVAIGSDTASRFDSGNSCQIFRSTAARSDAFAIDQVIWKIS